MLRRGRYLWKNNNNHYWLVYRPDHPDAQVGGWILEHRLVAERMIGRRLLRTEVVHHKDHDTQNNSESNLEVLPCIGEHTKLHKLRKRATLTCLVCGSTFERKQCEVGVKTFCSKTCYLAQFAAPA